MSGKTHSGLGKVSVRKASPLRLALSLVALFAFVYHGFLLQTHVHGLTPGSVAGAPLHGNTAPGDADHCLLCQEAVFAGNVITPAPVLLPLPAPALAAAPLPASRIAIARAPAHDWLGRGPPHRT